MLPPIITSAAGVAAVSLKLMVKVLLEFGVDAAFSVLFVSLKFLSESPPYWWRVRWMQGKNAKPGSEWNASSKRMFFGVCETIFGYFAKLIVCATSDDFLLF